jgi:hypothetical protein
MQHDDRLYYMDNLRARLPSIRTDTRADAARIRARFRRAPVQPRMCAMAVIVALEIEELRLQIRGRPGQGAVETFAPNGGIKRR